MKNAQLVMVILLIIEFFAHNNRLNKFNSKGSSGINLLSSIIRMSVIIGVLYWGNFWI